MKYFFLLLTYIASLLYLSFASADTIEFPKEELARESVLPVFDYPEAVKNRAVVTANHVEVGGFLGWTLNDPFFDPLNYGAYGTYHFNETHGINLLVNAWKKGPSRYSEQLQTDSSVQSNRRPNLYLAPQPEFMGTLSYELTAFYGKISLAKDVVMNLSLSGLLGAGMLTIGDTTVPVFSLGFAQKFYVSSRLAIRGEFRLLTYKGPDPLGTEDVIDANNPPATSEYDTDVFFRTLFTVGLCYLL